MENPFELKFQRSTSGLLANSRGKLVGSLLGKAAGARRAGSADESLWEIGGDIFRIHTISGGKTHISFNEGTEPKRLITALTEAGPDEKGPRRYYLYGLTLADCKEAARPWKGKTLPGRLSVSIGKVKTRVILGYADVPACYVETTDVGQRDEILEQIDALTPQELDGVLSPGAKFSIDVFLSMTSEPMPLEGAAEVCAA